MTELQDNRIRFTEANSFLRQSREGLIENHWDSLLKRLRAKRGDKAKRIELRHMAEDMVADGYYSAKNSITATEEMLLKKLYHMAMESGSPRYTRVAEWAEFVPMFAGASWFDPDPAKRRAPLKKKGH